MRKRSSTAYAPDIRESLLSAIEVQRAEAGEKPFPAGTVVQGISFLIKSVWHIYTDFEASYKELLDLIKTNERYSSMSTLKPKLQTWADLTRLAESGELERVTISGPVIVGVPVAAEPAESAAPSRRSPRSPRSVVRLPPGSEYRKY